MSLRIDDGSVYLDWDTWNDIANADDEEQAQRLFAVPGMEAAVQTARDPEAALVLDISAPGGLFTHMGWWSSNGLALLVRLDPEEYRLLWLPPDQFPSALARLVGTTPRKPGRRQPRPVDWEQLGDWFDEDPDVRAAGLALLGADRGWKLAVLGHGLPEGEAMMMAAADGPGGT
ncbi:MAG: hypothetical protein EOO70_05610, partial [Myxococcaceae bacterium]